MAGIPGGLEFDSEDESDIMHYSDSIYNSTPKIRDYEISNNPILNNEKSATTPSEKDLLQNVEYKKITPKKEVFLVSQTVALDDLRIAVIERKLDSIVYLLSQEIDVDCVLKCDWTALIYACSSGFPEIVDYLIRKGADVNYNKNYFSPLMALCSSKSKVETDLLTCCQSLIAKGAKIDFWDRHHMTALMYAARQNHIEIIKELIKNNVDLNRLDYTGWSALCWAASKGHGQVVRVLLEANADINKVTSTGDSAIEIAFNAGQDEIGNILLKIKNGVFSLKSSEVSVLDQPGINKSQSEDNYEITDSRYRSCSVFKEIELCLTGLNLQDWIPLFQSQAIEFTDFLLLNDEELINMGVDKIGVRKQILKGIRSIHVAEWKRTSLPNLKNQNFISCPDAVKCMANITSHMRVISSTVKYLKIQIQDTPRILELGQESANISALYKETCLSLKNCNRLKDEMENFVKHLNMIKDNVEFLPGDLIVNDNKNKRRSVKPYVVITIGTAVIGIVLAWRKPDWFPKWSHYLQMREKL